MREVAAFLRHDLLTATSYRVRTTLRLAGLVVLVVTVWLIADALQPMMGDVIRGQGEQYFAFVVIGLVGERFVSASLSSLPTAIASSIRTGTLEAWFATPARLPGMLAGLTAYGLLWTLLQAVILVTVAALLGAHFAGGRLPGAVVIVVLIVLAYVPFGLLAAAAVMAFRTSGPLRAIVVSGSVLLGGVYYPTEVIPSWLEYVSFIIPLSYGLRALRATLLEGEALTAVWTDLAILGVLAVTLLAVGSAFFVFALRYARRTGTLSQY